jgi:serine/threonine protein phosphatase PrpC
MIDQREMDTREFPSSQLGVETPEAISSGVQIDVAALSDKGNVRDQNEDHYFVARAGRHVTTILTNVPSGDVPSQFGETGYLMVVADGMGGRAAGEVASRLAITTLINITLHVPDWILRLDDEHAQKLMERAAARVRQVHDTLKEKARLDPRLKGMGTTMTAAFSLGNDLFVAQVGDSRAYLFRDGSLQRLTRDQTHAQMLADLGAISQDDVACHRLRHVLTNALGSSQPDVHAEIRRWKLIDGDRLLLCSDGLTDMIDDAGIAAVLGRETRSNEACQLLVEGALANGGRDNITVVLARYAMPEEAGVPARGETHP